MLNQPTSSPMMTRMLGLRCCCCWAATGALATKIARNDPITLTHSLLLTVMMHSNTCDENCCVCPRLVRGCALAVSLWGRGAAGELALGPTIAEAASVTVAENAFDVRSSPESEHIQLQHKTKCPRRA